MNKTKITKSAGLVRLVVYCEKTQQISQYEYVEINDKSIPGLLRFDKEEKKKKTKLYYDITGFVSLRNYLKKPLDRKKFCKILESIYAVLINIKDANFNQQKLLFDYRKVMVNPATDSVFFVYLPVQPYTGETSLKDFLLGIVDMATFTDEEDTSYIQEYIKILNEGVNFSLFELEKYIDKINGKSSSKQTQMILCPHCGAEIQSDEAYCSKCGKNIAKNLVNPVPVYAPPIEEPTDDPANDPNPQPFEEPVKDVPQPQKGGTAVLTTGPLESKVKASLSRVSDGQVYQIIGDYVKIGSDNTCHIVIAGNKYISHIHCVIRKDGDRFYISDYNSTNHTYVDGQIINDDPVEIFNNTEIKLANEKLILEISQ